MKKRKLAILSIGQRPCLKENDDITVEGYSALSRIAETEHLLLLRRSRDNWFFVEKSGIVGGTVDDLVKFLEARGLSRS